ncbi:glycogen synthase kinase-3 alpha-like [Sceloporus undulatus]|uniref:glycogen synthase kinase-3 alpha-like n=1 Tax=Sceloporus undulatus TaxID=8520 RepID=UPI001C4BD281|nr:glycogen synthase kinase-3 alpha-like [Sceloporus undulatus]
MRRRRRAIRASEAGSQFSASGSPPDREGSGGRAQAPGGGGGGSAEEARRGSGAEGPGEGGGGGEGGAGLARRPASSGRAHLAGQGRAGQGRVGCCLLPLLEGTWGNPSPASFPCEGAPSSCCYTDLTQMPPPDWKERGTGPGFLRPDWPENSRRSKKGRGCLQLTKGTSLSDVASS